VKTDRPTAGRRGLEGGVCIQVHAPKTIVRKTFRVSSALIRIECIIPVIDVAPRHRGVLSRLGNPKIEGFDHPAVSHASGCCGSAAAGTGRLRGTTRA
jgi:hypothetical protein